MREWKEAEISEQLHFLTRLVLWNLKKPFIMHKEQGYGVVAGISGALTSLTLNPVLRFMKGALFGAPTPEREGAAARSLQKLLETHKCK